MTTIRLSNLPVPYVRQGVSENLEEGDTTDHRKYGFRKTHVYLWGRWNTCLELIGSKKIGILAGMNLSWLDEAGIYKPNHTPFGAGILERELYT